MKTFFPPLYNKEVANDGQRLSIGKDRQADTDGGLAVRQCFP
jgi:hypothetical protein